MTTAGDICVIVGCDHPVDDAGAVCPWHDDEGGDDGSP